MNLKQANSSIQLDTLLDNWHQSPDCAADAVAAYQKRLETEVSFSTEYLDSNKAQTSMELDPYWPKWHSPWWHMTILYELGLAKRIPYRSIELLNSALDQYLHFFPFTEAEVPEGRDPIADIICQCALGTAHRILIAAGFDVDGKQPWIRDWFVRYQLKDGGYNCDEAVYAKENGKSSMISTVHIVESYLELSKFGLKESELSTLDRAVEYILRRRINRSLSKNNALICADWNRLTFPRFYDIDVLRTLNCVLRWAKLRQKQVPWHAIEEVVATIHAKAGSKTLDVEREFFSSEKTRIRLPDKSWLSSQPVSTFPLLVKTGTLGQHSPILIQGWTDAISDLRDLQRQGLISFDESEN